MKQRAAILAFVLALAGLCTPAHAQPAPDPKLSVYAKPARLVQLPSNRTLNLDCRGQGSPTILLLPGLTGWSQSWSPVHDTLAKDHRTCTFDPAGFGFSGQSPKPQHAFNIVADLNAALKKAKIKGPFVIVGHSAGGLLSLRFADLHRKDVAGMVLVDPSYPDQYNRIIKVAPHMADFFVRVMTGQQIAALEACAATAAKGPILPDDPAAQPCLFFEPTFPADMRAALAKAASDPKVMLTRKSHLAGIEETSRLIVKPKRSYGDLPLIVLTRSQMGPPPGDPMPGTPPEEKTEGPAMDADWVKAHDELAKLSTRGEHRTAPDTGHMIQFDNPDAVVQAVNDVIAKR